MDDIFDYDFTMGGGDQTYFGGNTLGDTSWIDNFDWGSALANLDFSGLDLGNISLDTLYQDLGDTGTLLGGGDFGGLDLSGISLDTPYQDLEDTGTLLNDLGIEGFAAAADEVGGAGGYDEEELKDKFWKEKLGAGTAVPGTGVLTTNDKGQTVIKYGDGTTKVLGGGSTDLNTISKLVDKLRATAGNKDNQMLMALLGGLLGLLNKGGSSKPVGYQGGIPKYTAARVPGRGVQYTRAATGGLMGLAAGGETRAARYLRGGTDGMADKIQTSIDGNKPARLSHGEFVIPADVVSHLGNGNSDAGADVLYEMMAKVRKARTGTQEQGKQINPRKYTPA